MPCRSNYRVNNPPIPHLAVSSLAPRLCGVLKTILSFNHIDLHICPPLFAHWMGWKDIGEIISSLLDRPSQTECLWKVLRSKNLSGECGNKGSGWIHVSGYFPFSIQNTSAVIRSSADHGVECFQRQWELRSLSTLQGVLRVKS